MSTPACRKVVAQIKRDYGFHVTLREHETIVSVTYRSNNVSVLIDTYKTQDCVRETRLIAHGRKLKSYNFDGATWIVQAMTIWDEDFVPVVQKHFNRNLTDAERADQREFEKLCYRPGTPQTPLDNYNRVWNGPTTPEMERY